MTKREERRARFFEKHPAPLERLFILLVSAALGALFFMLMVSIFLGADLEYVLILGTGLVLFSIGAVIIVKSKKIEIGSVIAVIMGTFVFIPLLFFRAGGIRSGVPLWFLFSTMFISFLMNGRMKKILLVANAAEAMMCYVLAYVFPEMVAVRTDDMKVYQEQFISMITIIVIMVVMISFEIDTLKEETERSREQQQEIKELNDAQNRFFSSMSHEIRTPINTIIGLNEMILREDTSDEVRENAAVIRSAGEMLLHLVNDILDMSKLESGQMTLVNAEYDLGKLLADISDMLRIRAGEKGLSFSITFTDGIPARLIGDEIRIKQILINLLNNAIKYTKEGSVTLAVQCERLSADDVTLTLSVSDTGRGIKPESIPHLFTAFKRVDEDENRYIEGTGLGLSIVKQFVDLMGGRITVDSIYTKGSTFTIELPQKSAGDEMLDPRKNTGIYRYHRSFEAPSAQILVVDDDHANLMVAAKLLRDTKVNVDTADSGETALNMTLQKKYDVILMDHIMPEMDGITCMRRIREQMGGMSRTTPVIALTANAGSDMKMLYEKEGFDGYLLKPTGGEALETEILRLLPRDIISYIDDDEDIGPSSWISNDRKRPLAITTESTADLPRELFEKLRVEVISRRVRTTNGLFDDRAELTTDGIMDYLRRNNTNRAVSVPPTQSDYVDLFSSQLRAAKNVIHIAPSSRIDIKNFDTAVDAARSFNNVTVVDSLSISSGQGFMVMEACRLAGEALSAEEIIKELAKIPARIHTSFLINDADYLARAGFITNRSAKVFKGLMLHPMVKVRDGKFASVRNLIGPKDYVRKVYLRNALFSIAEIDSGIIFVTHAGLDKSELKAIEDEIRNIANFEKIIFMEACSAIAIGCGPGTFGVSYMTKM
ncbi:MAG: DegV family EDD domain-containing protein [Oscillospiraceae bacterium]|nr:DegV family EDD domain-containing protein [Oscillospiraceae bacterium]